MSLVRAILNKFLDVNGYDHTLNLDGVHAFVFSVKDRGQEITVSGWDDNHRRFEPGQRVLLIQEGGSETRYEVESVDSMMNPPDQYFMEMKFSPRSSHS
ncbi:MAG: hypothetical protein AB2792_23075 [Candidatus Thiodiazotropha sp.]